jgi:hypothetical protein
MTRHLYFPVILRCAIVCVLGSSHVRLLTGALPANIHMGTHRYRSRSSHSPRGSLAAGDTALSLDDVEAAAGSRQDQLWRLHLP